MKNVKHIILISIDNLRYDCIGYQPDKRELIKHDVLKYLETPTLDHLAEKSTCFTQAISTNTYTTASHASILTGLYPPKHGVRTFFNSQLKREAITLAEVFRAHGYHTILATDTEHLFKPMNLDRGFTHLFMRDDHGLLSFLDQIKEEHIFLFVHFFDVHAPFLFSEYGALKGCNDDYYEMMEGLYKKLKLVGPPSINNPYDSWNNMWTKVHPSVDFLLPLYVKGVTKFDQGRFRRFINSLDCLGLLKDSLIFVFSDHGEGRVISEDPSFFAHAGELFDDVIRVPLMVFHPEWGHSLRDHQITTVDLFPTLIELILQDRLEKDFKTDGNSLAPSLLRQNETNPLFLAYCETWRGKSLFEAVSDEYLLWQRGIRVCNKKFLLYGNPENCLDGTVFDSNPLDFVKTLRRNLLNVFEEPGRFPVLAGLLYEGELSKGEVFHEFLREYITHAKKFEVYDLNKDPFEKNPIDLSGQSWPLAELTIALSKIFSLTADPMEEMREVLC
jgi:arylsulfatase A-like enzyme